MNELTLKRVRAIATSVRRQVELYDEEVAYCEDGKLDGLCRVSSVALQRKLAKKNIKSTLITGSFGNRDAGYGWYHTWLECRDKIIDITATQFGVRKKVYIVSSKNRQYSNGVEDFPEAIGSVEMASVEHIERIP